MSSLKFKYTASLDPTHFHCIRYIGPPLNINSSKNPKENGNIYYKFNDKLVAMLTFTWSEREPILIVPFWMKTIFEADSEIQYEKVVLEQVEEFKGTLRLEWFANLGPNSPKTIPLEDILPKLFGLRRPLCNGTVLPFIFKGNRYLLRVYGEGVGDGKLFWFDLMTGNLDFIRNNDCVNESDDCHYESLRVLLDGSWLDEFKVLKHHFKVEGEDHFKNGIKQLFLICGVTVPFQQELIKALKIDFELLDVSSIIPEEHFSVDDLDPESLNNSSKLVFVLEDVEKISNDLMTEILKRIPKKSILICLTSSRSVEAHQNLLQLERNGSKLNFQVSNFTFGPLKESERFEILRRECFGKNFQGEFDELLCEFRWLINSLNLVDLMRVGKLFKFERRSENNTIESALRKAFEGVKEVKNSQNSLTSYSILSASSAINTGAYPFTGNLKVKEQFLNLLKGPLLNSEAYDRFGLPKSSGFLLHGPAGGGKTSLCLNIFTSPPCSNIFTIFHVPSASQLLSKYFGETEANIRKLFGEARERKPSIIFIDQIECLGRRRGLTGSDGGGGSSDRYLSTLLNEMDGIGSNDGVSVVACANDIKLLDEALLRPGRLDRHFYIPVHH